MRAQHMVQVYHITQIVAASKHRQLASDMLLLCGHLCRNLTFAGSVIGNLKMTQEMLDFCGQHNIHADVEVGGLMQPWQLLHHLCNIRQHGQHQHFQ